jgi:hypothetical protein
MLAKYEDRLKTASTPMYMVVKAVRHSRQDVTTTIEFGHVCAMRDARGRGARRGAPVTHLLHFNNNQTPRRMSQTKPLPLRCPAQQYAWGKVGMASTVAQVSPLTLNSVSSLHPGAAQLHSTKTLTTQNNRAQLLVGSGQTINATEPYAELWMGTHPTNPSYVAAPPDSDDGDNAATATDEVLLQEHLGGRTLPYLFKVLSIAKALSIQAHPHKALAEKLHAERPLVYKDDNHKPGTFCLCCDCVSRLSLALSLAFLLQRTALDERADSHSHCNV